MSDVTIAAGGTQATPLDYPIPGAAELKLKCLAAQFTSSGGAYVPTVQLLVGGSVIASFPLGQSVAAAGSADVAWFPGVAGGGSGAAGNTAQLRAPVLDTPDSSGFVYPELTTALGFSNIRRLLPYFTHGGAGAWTGSVRVPADYAANPRILVSAVANATTGAVRWIIGTAVVAAGVSEDTAVTNEAAQNVTVAGTALQRFDATFILSTAPVAGVDLNIVLTRDGGNAGDTCTAPVGVWAITFLYTT